MREHVARTLAEGRLERALAAFALVVELVLTTVGNFVD
jgi:hypothetical protein